MEFYKQLLFVSFVRVAGPGGNHSKNGWGEESFEEDG
jgi:hypothetical protein